ncbi:MAG: hypothetical protein SNH28_00715 [Rikenellaceae bacterium]
MKKRLLVTLLSLCVVAGAVAQEEAQSQKEVKREAKDAATGQKYRRSSLCLIMLEDDKVMKGGLIKDAFLKASMPDKYNDHNVGKRVFSMREVKVTPEDATRFEAAVKLGVESEAAAVKAASEIMDAEEPAAGEAPKKKKGGGGFGKLMNAVATTAVTGSTAPVMTKDEVDVASYKYICDNKFANEMVKRWFLDAEGKPSAALMSERGLYDASSEDIALADLSQIGVEQLKYAGADLVNGTFVVVSRYNYISKDDLVAQFEKAAMLVASTSDSKYATVTAKSSVVAFKAALGEGYYVQTTSSLFQLHWNDEVSETFYQTMWDKPEAWADADLFKFKYIGTEKAMANVKAGIFTKKSDAELILGATMNAMDDVLAKLEKKYEVFKTKTPLVVKANEDGSVKLTAKIGLKEGLRGGDKFEVLMPTQDKKTLKTTYKRMGTIKVDKEQIWDNRHDAVEELKLKNATQSFEETSFTLPKGASGNKYTSGLLIKQVK